MDSNTTCIPGNSTSDCPTPPAPSNVGLAVVRQAEKGAEFRIQEKNTERKGRSGEAPKIVKEIHQKPSQAEISSSSQTPIYENVTRAAAGHGVKAKRRSAPQPEDDVYLQCDAIYSNDPACHPPAEPHHEDDTYIIPDS
ncbi:hypothetical protein WMY93_000334 [Mugilogobius chulae]|uniref:Uncharacterized protein n=1 Tax=Mugilogobius chulae TaxID=88201 RepID=A0AAW0Q0K8_9GOBI